MESRASLLEFQELEAGPDGNPVELYSELLALYLLNGDLCNAKFLWKRVPPVLKQNTELAALWVVSQKMWSRDMPGFYSSVQSFQWSPTVAPIINNVVESKREQLLRLIGTAYTSVHPQDVATLLGMTSVEVEAAVTAKGWTNVEGLLQPKEPLPVDAQLTTADDQLGKLTDFVSFLEN